MGVGGKEEEGKTGKEGGHGRTGTTASAAGGGFWLVGFPFSHRVGRGTVAVIAVTEPTRRLKKMENAFLL